MRKRLIKAGRRGKRRRGFVLIAVLVIVVILSLAAYQFSEFMTAEYKAADSYTRSAQARAAAQSGIAYAAVLLSNQDAFTNTLNSNPYDNSSAFSGILVRSDDSPRHQARFSIIAPLSPDESATNTQPYRNGVLDEGGKINLNALMQLDPSGQVLHDMLMLLPNMTEEIANAILDWLDPDDDPRASGAESDYYSALNPPYRAKNGPLETLEELLYVRGVTPQLLFGNDLNRNGILDPEEDDGSGVLDRGWSAYLTVYSREQNLASDGTPRIYVNDSDLNTLYDNLSTAVGQDLANYIIAYRMYGPAGTVAITLVAGTTGAAVIGVASSGAGTGQATAMQGGAGTTARSSGAAQSGGTNSRGGGGTPALTRGNLGNLSGGRPQSIGSLYALVNSSVSIPSSTPGGQAMVYPSPLNDPGQLAQLLPIVLDKLTTIQGSEIQARINVNTAPQAVLAALPGLSPADVQSIISLRPSPSTAETTDSVYLTPAWLITQANLSPQTMRALERYITTRTQVYRVQSVGYFDGGGPSVRLEAVIDTNSGKPRIVYWRDLSELGKGYDLQNQE
jgi:type II secretory pathway component PulK